MDELEALLLDAGNTLVFLDLGAVAEVARDHGIAVDPVALLQEEGAAKRHYERELAAGASHESGWRLYLQTLLVRGGSPPEAAEALIGPLRAAHDRMNLWRRVPDGLREALAEARSMGLRLGVVSNSEGKLRQLFEHVGLDDAFEVVVDSALEGVRKPDPEIFHRALRRMGVSSTRALYAGDIPLVDVDGARAAGLHAALIDPFEFYPDHASSPRFASVAELIRALRLQR